MSHIIEALKRAQKERAIKDEKDKGLKISNILAPVSIAKKKLSFFNNLSLIVIGGSLISIAFIIFFLLTMATARKELRGPEHQDTSNQAVTSALSKKDGPQMIARETHTKTDETKSILKKEPPELKTHVDKLPQSKEPALETSTLEHEQEKLLKPVQQDSSNQAVTSALSKKDGPQMIARETHTKTDETKSILKKEPPELKTHVDKLPQSKEPVSEIPASEHEKDNSGHISIKSKYPQSPIYHFNLGIFYQGEKKLERAKEEYEEVISLDPFNVEAHNNLGMIYKDLERFDKSIAEYKKALAIDPQYQKAYYNLAVALYLKGDIKRAAIEARLAISLNPNDSESYNILSLSYKKMNKYQDAIEALQNALGVDSNHAQTHYNLALLLEEGGRMKDATFHYQKFIDFSRSGNNRELIEEVKKHLEQMPLQ